LDINKILKIIRVLREFWLTSIACEMEYRFNLYIEMFSVIGNLIGSIFILSLFYRENSTLSGWSWSESVFVLGTYTFLEGFTITVLQPNLSKIVDYIQNGTLDFVLLKPINSQLWLSLRFISPWGLPSLLSGLTLMLVSSFKILDSINLSLLLLFVISLINSVLLLYSIWFILATTSIWFVRVWNANEVLKSTLAAGRFPISSYPPLMRFFFTFILPIAFLTTVPSSIIFDRNSGPTLLMSVVLTIFFLFTANTFWKFAIKFYSSASS